MAKKKYDMAVKVGEYNGKGKYENIGAVIQGDNGPYIMLKRTFNPAGVPGSDGRDSILVSLFEPRQKDQQHPKPQPAPADGDDFDDDIPF